MEILRVENQVSVILFTVELSEGELQLFEMSLSHLLQTLSPEAAEELTGFEPAFLMEIREELFAAIRKHCLTEFLPDRYKNGRDE